MVKYEHLFSDRARRAVASEIREILKVMSDPEMISFAGGIPNPESFPVEQISEIAKKVLTESPEDTLQYGITEGYEPLRETLSDFMKKQGVSAGPEEIIVTSGATQTIDLCAQAFLQAGRHVITESPSFLAALLDFRSHYAEIDDVKMDSDGLRVDALAERIADMRRKGAKPTMLYVIPNFQNPTGVTLSEKRRKDIVGLAEENDFLILEDDPYGQLRFEGEHIRPVKAFDDSGRVVYASSFSKILSPGMRIGWAVAPPEITKKLAIMKQTTDVHTSVFSQRIAEEYIRGGYLEKQLPKIRALYGRKQRVMLGALERYFPKGAEWTHPEGGMFLWATLPKKIDTLKMLPKALERKVAYIHGRQFYPNGGGENEMRMNFTHPADELIVEGVRRLGGLIEEEIGSG
jgi:2-aminoadipate transaminase